MTIFSDLGDIWIEEHETTVTISDAAGQYDSVIVNYDKPGRIVGATILINSGGASNDNTQAMGQQVMLNSAGGFVYGQAVTGFRIRIRKQAGTAGDTVVGYLVVVWLKK